MTQIKALLIAVVLLLLPSASFAAGQLVTLESKFSVDETVDRLTAALDGKGIKVAARIDHAAGAKAAGLDMPPTQVVMFGNPMLGTPLMLANPDIAIDLPMKMLVWQDGAGKVLVGYQAPDDLKARYGITGADEIFKKMSGALAAFAKAATGTE